MGWWTDPVGGGKKKAPAQKEKGWWSAPVGGTAKTTKCPACGKTRGCKCTMSDKHTNKVKVVRTGKDGRKRTVTVNAPYVTDTRGFDWCSTCSSRVHNGKCMNVTCSTRR